jgi:hypothetical protein
MFMFPRLKKDSTLSQMLNRHNKNEINQPRKKCMKCLCKQVTQISKHFHRFASEP